MENGALFLFYLLSFLIGFVAMIFCTFLYFENKSGFIKYYAIILGVEFFNNISNLMILFFNLKEKIYLLNYKTKKVSVIKDKKSDSDFGTEREILYKVLFDMKSDLNDLKKLTMELMESGNSNIQEKNKNLIQKIYGSNQEENEIDFEDQNEMSVIPMAKTTQTATNTYNDSDDNYLFAETVEEEEVWKLEQKEIEMIKKSLEKNKGKRKAAADELGISERTLYRKIKQFDL